ncbi:MAG: 23S rRNA (pseudouridine(1915)-N(3))-methyltransferase RlmH [Bacillota bacterium]|nr:23S rRNA (pseudouridine(1915)-N(3))-methyltransferase RlmH [Bacillota bacterium]
MNISIICVGKLKEDYWKEACQEYIKRLGRFGKIDVIELSESKSDNIDEESTEIISHLPKNAYIIALDVNGNAFSSEEFAAKIENLAIDGVSHIAFIIGGSNGYNDTVRKAANVRLSFSSFTFPHQMMRVILLEQIYRAFKINANEKYHK